jgi:NTP pyrophosphatase (non-canonical NTP hydrolase)
MSRFSDELRVIAAYQIGRDLSDRLQAADATQKAQSEALKKAADEIDRLNERNAVEDELIGIFKRGTSMDELIAKVEQWARDRQIIPHSNPQSQLMKTVSELGELADATLKNDRAGIVDGVGDVIVTLVIYAALQGVKLEDCLASAYVEIKDRKGTLTPEGVFVKEAT